MTHLQSALEALPDPTEQQWSLAGLAFIFDSATAAAVRQEALHKLCGAVDR